MIKWTDEMDKYIRKNIGKKTRKSIAEDLDVSPTALSMRMNLLMPRPKKKNMKISNQ